ncbi:MAG: carbohydrate kinase family protein [Verrucomicrobiota bacterium]|jgi:sugar/nucleoside kinase (ribokinase family)
MSILCVGQLVADIVVRPVARLPVSGRTDLVEDLQLLSGGCAANTAAVLAKLGAETRLAALIGRDILGDAVLADLKAAGVRLEAVVRDAAAPTTAALVMVSPTGERSFFYRRGGNEQLANHHLPDTVLKSASLVHVGGAMKLINLDLAELLERAKSFSCVTSLDTDWDVQGDWMKKLAGALPKLDYLLTNQEEAAMLTGEQAPRDAARKLLARGPQAVVVKRGECGALLATPSGVTEFPAFRVKVRDTTCAGDCFAAGFLLGISRGWPLDQSLRLANAAGALSTTQISHRAITSLNDLQRLIETQSLPATLNPQPSTRNRP